MPKWPSTLAAFLLACSFVVAVALNESWPYVGRRPNARRLGEATTTCELHGEPKRLAHGQGRVTFLAIDPENIYWASDGEIVRLAKRGGHPRAIADGVVDCGRIASDGQHVYWLDRGTGASDGSLARTSTSGGAVEVLASPIAAREGLAVDASRVYWGAGSQIHRRDKARGDDRVVVENVDITALDVGNSGVYWANADRDDLPRIGRVEENGAQEVVLGRPAPGFSMSVRAFGDDVCWTSRAASNDGGLWCLSRGKGAPRQVASGEAWTFAVRGQLAYWIRATDSGSELVCTPLQGGASAVVATGKVADVVADDSGVYFSDLTGFVGRLE